jgi:MFS family permease
VLTVLCITEITSWGILYYAFPVLAPGIAADTGWSISMITAAFSLGLVVSAVVGIPAGRWLDRSSTRSPSSSAGACRPPPPPGHWGWADSGRYWGDLATAR